MGGPNQTTQLTHGGAILGSAGVVVRNRVERMLASRSSEGGKVLAAWALGRGCRCKAARSQSSRHAAPGILALV